MSDFIYNITNNYQGLGKEDHERLKRVEQIVNINNHQNLQIMASVQELNDKVDQLTAANVDLQATVDSEQADIKAILDNNVSVVADLTQQIADLKAAAAGKIDPAELDPITAKIDASIAAIATTKEDIAGTV